MFLERLKVFDYNNNKYYKPNGKFNTRSATDSIAMPNCTMYCYLRMQEASDQSKLQTTWIRSSGGFGNAKTWYSTTTLPKGDKLREGSIAVFDGNCGHVAFVERVIDDTHALISESNYDSNKNLRNWKFWTSKTVELKVGKATLSGVGKLLGFIYIPVTDLRTSRNKTVDQVEINQTMVNVRQKPTTKGALVAQGLYCPVGIFNVLEWAAADGYTWARLDTNTWVACGSWSNIYKKESTSKKELQAKLKELKAKKSSLEAELTSVNKEIKAIEAKLK